MGGHHRYDALGLLHRAAKGDHHFDIDEPHVTPYARERSAFKREAFGVACIVGARGATEAEHGVFFLRLECAPTEEPRILVCLEVAGADDDRLGIERRSDAANALAEASDEIGARVFFPDPCSDVFPGLLVSAVWRAAAAHTAC